MSSKPSILVKWTKLISEIFLWKFPDFYYTSNFLRILRFLLHLKQLSCKTNHHERSENLPFSRNLVTAERKRRAQGGAMWTEDNKKSDANHMAWINLIQSNTAHCAKWGLVRVLHWCRIRSSVRPRPLWGLFLSPFEKTEGGGFMKEHSKTEIESESESEKLRLFHGANLVVRPAL